MDQSYAPLRELKNFSNEPINAMLFSENAKYLIVAGDAEKVFVWNIESFECEQTLEDANWGQITSMAWIYQDVPNREISTTLCVGNARGSLSLYAMDPREVKPFPKPPTKLNPFRFNDPVEKQAFDKLNHRLAVASHSGEIKMYETGTGPLNLLWEGKIGDSIPSSLLFYGGANQNLLTTSLESSEICCRNALDNTVSWKKTVTGGIGYATMTSDEALMLVNNLTTGNFDLYNVSEDSPLRSLPVGPGRRFVKQCQFFEGSRLAVCGSDTNKIYVVDVVQNYVVQTLTTGKKQDMTQTVAVTPASSRRVIIAGACRGSVYLWEKGQSRASIRAMPTFHALVDKFFRYGLHFALFVTYPVWLPLCRQLVGNMAQMPGWSSSKSPAPLPSDNPAFVQAYMLQPSIAPETSVSVRTVVVFQTQVAVQNPDVVQNPVVVDPVAIQIPAAVQNPVVVQTPVVIQTPISAVTPVAVTRDGAVAYL